MHASMFFINFFLNPLSSPTIDGSISRVHANNSYFRFHYHATNRNLEEDAIAELKDKKQPKEWNAPAWTQGLIVKPDQAHIKSQVQIWGVMSLMGLALPPFIQYANRFSWMVCVAQLSFRGMAKQEGGGGGFGVMRMGNGPGEKKHLKVAWLLGISITIVGAVVTYGLMPQWAKGHRLTPTLAFAMRNFIYGVACSYLQPYKG